MRVEVDGNVERLLQPPDDFEGPEGGKKASHIFQAEEIDSQILKLARFFKDQIDCMDWADAVAVGLSA